MLKIFFDHDFNHKILRGLEQRIAELDYLTPNHLGNIIESDENHLIWALENGRVVVSHDVNTMTEAANERLKNGRTIFGLILVPQEMPIGEAITELEIIINCSEAEDFENLVLFLPLGLT